MDFSQIRDYDDFIEKTGMDVATSLIFLSNELEKRGYEFEMVVKKALSREKKLKKAEEENKT